MVNRQTAAPDLDEIFAALAHPIRRAILEQLSGRDATVSELAAPHRVSLPAVSKHLRVLEDARLITVEPEGRVRRCQIDAAPLSAAFGWLTRYRVLWEDRLGRLATHLAQGPRKSKVKETRRKRRAN
jgi:DNA-binding transcriptional ArsR family regulator